jgi:protein lifeguard
MIVTTVFCTFCYINEPIREYIREETWLYVLTAIMAIVLAMTLACVRSLARSVPTNYVLLFAFTICESYAVATISSFYEPVSVLEAAILSVVLFSILTIYALKTEGNLEYLPVIIMTGLIIGLCSMILMFIFPSQLMFLVICWVGLILTCVYVIYDVYLISSNYGLEYDDYIIGAMLLYLDLINLFIYILSIIGDRRN